MTTKDLLRPLADPDSVPFAVTSAALIGAGTLIDPNRLTTGGRLAYRFGTAAFTGVSVMLGLRKGPQLPPAIAVGGVVGVMGAMLAISEATEALDARIQRAMLRAGVRRPRLALACGAAALSLATYAFDRAAARRAATEIEELDAGPELRPLAPEVRSLLDGMLATTDDHAAAALRAQLDTAQEQLWSNPDEDARFIGMVEFTVDETLPRAIPHDFTFPVRARFATPQGVPVEATLGISGGRLASLIVDIDLTAPGVEELDYDDPLEGLTAWPSRAEVRYVMDTAD